jgi:hypothetical protein
LLKQIPEKIVTKARQEKRFSAEKNPGQVKIDGKGID